MRRWAISDGSHTYKGANIRTHAKTNARTRTHAPFHACKEILKNYRVI